MMQIKLAKGNMLLVQIGNQPSLQNWNAYTNFYSIY